MKLYLFMDNHELTDLRLVLANIDQDEVYNGFGGMKGHDPSNRCMHVQKVSQPVREFD